MADGSQHIRIWENTLEFSSTVLSTLSLYLVVGMGMLAVKLCTYKILQYGLKTVVVVVNGIQKI